MFANQVKNVRIQLEMSQKKLANALGVSFATINRWENSRNEPSQLAKNSFYEFCESNFIDVNELKKALTIFLFIYKTRLEDVKWPEQIYYAN